MMKQGIKIIGLISIVLASALFLFACSDSAGNNAAPIPDPPDPDPVSRASYQVTVTNLTNNQPFSPPVVVLHTATYVPWETGAGASEGLEVLAEGGDGAQFAEEAEDHFGVLAVTAGDGIVMPGAEASFDIEAIELAEMRLSLATMLVNTNDAYTGVAGVPLEELSVNERKKMTVAAYDAGTEANSETAASIPGPAGGGEGFNVARDDNDVIVVHPGVITSSDGLVTSVLDESHGWRNPVALIEVTRIK